MSDNQGERTTRRGALAALVGAATAGCLRLESDGSTTAGTATTIDATTATTEADTTEERTDETADEATDETTEEPADETTTEPAEQPPERWHQFGSDAANAGFVEATPVDGRVYAEWEVDFEGRTNYGPAVDDDTAYVVDDAGTVRALDAATGGTRWRAEVDAGVASRPAVADGSVYVAVNAVLYAFDVDSGRERWRTDQPITLPGALTVHDGVVYAGTHGDDRVVAFDATDGRERWRNAVSGAATTPAVADGVVLTSYAGDDPERTRIRAMDVDSGATTWEYAFDGGTDAESSVSVVDDVAYAGSDSAEVAAVDVADGGERWHRELDASVDAVPTVGPERVFVATREAGTGGPPSSGIRALDRETGESAWRSAAIPRLVNESATALVGDHLYCVDHAGTLYALDRETGEQRWQLTAGDGALSGPAVAHGRVYATGEGSAVAVGTRGESA